MSATCTCGQWLLCISVPSGTVPNAKCSGTAAMHKTVLGPPGAARQMLRTTRKNGMHCSAWNETCPSPFQSSHNMAKPTKRPWLLDRCPHFLPFQPCHVSWLLTKVAEALEHCCCWHCMWRLLMMTRRARCLPHPHPNRLTRTRYRQHDRDRPRAQD